MSVELTTVINQLRTTLGKMEVALSAIADCIVWTNGDGHVEWCNAPFDQLVNKGHILILGKRLSAILPLEQESCALSLENYPTSLAVTKGPGSGIYQFTQNSKKRSLEISWSLIRANTDRSTIVLSIRDVTERLMAQKALEREIGFLHLYESISNAANGAYEIEQALRFTIERICEHTAWPLGHAYMTAPESNPAQMLPSTIWFSLDPARFADFRQVTEGMPMLSGVGLPGRVLKSKQPEWIIDVTADFNFPRAEAAKQVGLKSAYGFPILASGVVVAVLEFFSPRMEEPDARLLQVVAYVGTSLGRAFEVKQSEDKLLHRALHDTLTGLPNRTYFSNVVNQALIRTTRRPNYQFAVLFLDLDRFKIINDSLGHLAGDELLIGVARRLQKCLRTGDVVARLGGDEFTVFLDDINMRSDGLACQNIARRIKSELEQTFNLQGQQIYTSASIGIAMSRTGYQSSEEILRDADIAMYRSKANGGSNAVIFDQVMHSSAMGMLQLETDLRKAMENNELTLHYQPIVSMVTSRICGFEALIRWQHPERGNIPPLEFIPLAEDTRLILSIGRWVIEEACKWLASLPASAGAAAPGISINVSGVQFTDAGMISHLKEVLNQTGINPERVSLEITESAMIEQIAKTEALIQKLSDLKVQLQIDDFGTGYSSLGYLSRLPIQALKIDREFVATITTNTGNLEIVRCIMALAGTLNLDVIAEGVETVEQASLLTKLGCEYVQGFLYFRPLDSQSARDLVVSDLNS